MAASPFCVKKEKSLSQRDWDTLSSGEKPVKVFGRSIGPRHSVVVWHLAAMLWLAQVPIAVAGVLFVRGHTAGFVVSDIKYALAPDAKETGACPLGMSRSPEEIYAMTPQGRRHKGESDKHYAARLREGAHAISTAPNGQNLCMHPEAGKPDPYFRTVRSSDIPVYGIDLDGKVSSGDFPGIDGQKGVDNQFYRVVGCTRSYQSSGQANGFAIEMLTGSWGILLTLSDVDDIHNDDYVKVGIYASADPIRLSPTRVPLSYATYAMDQDPRFRATTTGRIKDGVLTTKPVDVRFHYVLNSMRLDRVLKAARIRATLSKDGVLEGYLAGYTPVAAMYNLQYGFRNGRTGSGKLAPLALRSGSANGAARVLEYTCNGAYYALRRYADGNPDPATGRYTSISTQYRFKAIPAFVVDVKTESVNAKLNK